MKLKILLWTALSFSTYATAGTPAAQRACAVPVTNIKVETLMLGEHKSAVFQRFPSWQKAEQPQNHAIYMPDLTGLSWSPRIAFVEWVGYDEQGHIDGWNMRLHAPNDSDSTRIDYGISPEALKAELIHRYGFPSSGWQKSVDQEVITQYRYTCRDYSILIRQDYGAVEQGTGAQFWVTRKPL